MSRIVEATGCEIVLSSSWRASDAAIRVVVGRLRSHGSAALRAAVSREPLLTTDLRAHTVRQWEIAAFLERCCNAERGLPVIEAWCALDDEPLVDGPEQVRYRSLFVGRAAFVDSKSGLQDEHVHEAIAALKSPIDPPGRVWLPAKSRG